MPLVDQDKWKCPVCGAGQPYIRCNIKILRGQSVQITCHKCYYTEFKDVE